MCGRPVTDPAPATKEGPAENTIGARYNSCFGKYQGPEGMLLCLLLQELSHSILVEAVLPHRRNVERIGKTSTTVNAQVFSNGKHGVLSSHGERPCDDVAHGRCCVFLRCAKHVHDVAYA